MSWFLCAKIRLRKAVNRLGKLWHNFWQIFSLTSIKEMSLEEGATGMERNNQIGGHKA